jgi:hypothetical protein
MLLDTVYVRLLMTSAWFSMFKFVSFRNEKGANLHDHISDEMLLFDLLPIHKK